MALCWGGSRSTKPCVFPCKVAAAGDESYLVCVAVAAGVVWFLRNNACSCVRSSMRSFFKIPFEKCFKIVFLSLWRRDPSGFGAAISDAIARSSIVLCNSVSADRIVVAASRLLGAAAACVILLSFAAEDRKSYWNDCIKAAKLICQQIFSILALIIFLFKFLLQVLQNRLFVALASRSGFGAAIPVVIIYKKASLCIFSVKACCVSKLLCV